MTVRLFSKPRKLPDLVSLNEPLPQVVKRTMFTPSEALGSPECTSKTSAGEFCLGMREELDRIFQASFAILDGLTGETVLTAKDQPALDWTERQEVIREVVRRGRAEIIDEEGPLLLLAIPVGDDDGAKVAAAAFVTHTIGPLDEIGHAASALGMREADARQWASRQSAWAPTAIERMAAVAIDVVASRRRIETLDSENRSLSAKMSATHEELSLLNRLTPNLKLSTGVEDLARLTLDWLAEVLPAEGLAIYLLPPPASHSGAPGRDMPASPVLLRHGKCPLGQLEMAALMEKLGESARRRPLVLNTAATSHDDWAWPEVRQVVIVSLEEGRNLFGWMVIFNHLAGGEFDSVAASLMNSVGTILGIHSGNTELYRQQSELFAGIVRALTAAIDAKDPYTCGHSDRVARIAVRLAEQLGCDPAAQDRIYLAGLLHDIGKIGIDDRVLRKPDKLSDEEYSHIKSHAGIGYRMLNGLGRLGDVLPAVLCHHESWDGGGYPQGLKEQEIPLFARIVAVADSFDAMASDRPYRKGMDLEKIDSILRAGAGRQWDPEVIAAFFAVQDDIHQVLTRAEQPLACEI